MDVYGDEENVWAFRSACSFSFSLVEQLTGGLEITFNNDGVLMGILNNLAHGDKLEISFENGYILVRIESDFERMLLIDLETGIIRDFFSSQNIMGNPCYHDDITDAIVNFTNNLLNISSKLSSDLNKLINFSVMFSGVFSSMVYELSGTGTLSFSGIGLGSLFSVFSAALLIPVTIGLCMPFWADAYESMGYHDLAEWYRTHNIFDILENSFRINTTYAEKYFGMTVDFIKNQKITYNDVIRALILLSDKKQIAVILGSNFGSNLIKGFKNSQGGPNGTGEGDPIEIGKYWDKTVLKLLKAWNDANYGEVVKLSIVLGTTALSGGLASVQESISIIKAITEGIHHMNNTIGNITNNSSNNGSSAGGR